MNKTSAVPVTSEAVALLTNALAQGHAITLSLAAPPRVVRAPPAVTTCCLTFGITPSQSRVLLALMEHGCVGREDLHAAMSDGRGTSKIKTVDVVINRIRRKLAGHDIAITAVWGQGYRLDENGRDRLRKLLAEYDAKPDTPP